MCNFVIFGFILSLSFPASVFAAENLPAGFITVSETPMTWADAKAYCQQQGGKLPLMGDSESLAADDISKRIPPVDGFGPIGDPWPSGLSFAYYWSGTVNSDRSGESWVVLPGNGIDVSNNIQSLQFQLVCVP